MYIEAIISVDPSQLTNIGAAKPTKLFAKLARALTRGMTAKREEQETFTAVTILQQLNMVLRSLDINDIVRITKDSEILFEDTEGKKDDLKEAITHFVDRAAQDESMSLFETLTLVLQHSEAGADYLLDVQVKRTHVIGEHPIQIRLSAFPCKLNAAGDDKRLRENMRRVFASQKAYDGFTAKFRSLTEAFVDKLKDAFTRHMKVDDVQSTLSSKVIRPNRRVTSRQEIPEAHSDADYGPAFSNYYGRDDAFLYAWFWVEMCHDNEIQCRDCTLVDESGMDVLAIGPDGLNAGAGETMNVDVPMQQDGSTGIAPLTETSGSAGVEAATSDGGSWLGSISDTIGDIGSSFGDAIGSIGDSFGGDGGGSSCGSCGGGCGGGD